MVSHLLQQNISWLNDNHIILTSASSGNLQFEYCDAVQKLTVSDGNVSILFSQTQNLIV